MMKVSSDKESDDKDVIYARDINSENTVNSCDAETTIAEKVVSTPIAKTVSTPLQANDSASRTGKPMSPPAIAVKNDASQDISSAAKIKLEDVDIDPMTDATIANTEIAMPHSWNLFHPSRKLSFEDEHSKLIATPCQKRARVDEDESREFGMGGHLVCHGNQDTTGISPVPIGLEGFFPSSALEDMNSFPPVHIQQFQLDESYCSNLLGSAFIPSPNDEGIVPSCATHIHPLFANIHDIRAQYTVPPFSSSNGSTDSNQCPPFLVKSLPKLGCDGYNEYNENGESEEGAHKRTKGKTLDNLQQISANTSKRKKSTKPQTHKMARNLPLRKRHAKLEEEQMVLTTPMPVTRPQTRNMVSRSASAEKKKKETSFQSKPSRNRSKRQSKSSTSRTSSTANARFHDASPSNDRMDGVEAIRIIQHFTPKRHTVPILSTERKLPRTVIFGCKCSKSKCLKLYCDCFQAGQVCADKCTCKSCLNTVDESGKAGRRTEAIQTILDRRPDAFDVRVKKSGEGCSCKKNRCLKKYCDCFNIGVKCNEEQCRCVDCENFPSDDDQQGDESSVSFVDEQDDTDLNENDDEVEEDKNIYYQHSYEQDEYISSGFIDMPSSNIVLDETACSLFQDQDDIAAV